MDFKESIVSLALSLIVSARANIPESLSSIDIRVAVFPSFSSLVRVDSTDSVIRILLSSISFLFPMRIT